MRWLYNYALVLALIALHSETQAAPQIKLRRFLKVTIESESSSQKSGCFVIYWLCSRAVTLLHRLRLFRVCRISSIKINSLCWSNLQETPSAIDLEESYMKSASTIAERLDTLGVRKNSDLGKRLVEGYVIFSQMLRLDGQPPSPRAT